MQRTKVPFSTAVLRTWSGSMVLRPYGAEQTPRYVCGILGEKSAGRRNVHPFSCQGRLETSVFPRLFLPSKGNEGTDGTGTIFSRRRIGRVPIRRVAAGGSHRSPSAGSGQALRRESPASRATPLPQDDSAASSAAGAGLILWGALRRGLKPRPFKSTSRSRVKHQNQSQRQRAECPLHTGCAPLTGLSARFSMTSLRPDLEAVLPVSGLAAGVGYCHDLDDAGGTFAVNQSKGKFPEQKPAIVKCGPTAQRCGA